MFRKISKGFTLIELLVVIAIIGILAILIFLALQRAQKSARDAQRKSLIRDTATAEAMYYDANKHYGSWTDLTSGGTPYLTSNTSNVLPWTSGNSEGTWLIGTVVSGTLDCDSTPPGATTKKFCISSRLEADSAKGFRCTQDGCADTLVKIIKLR